MEPLFSIGDTVKCIGKSVGGHGNLQYAGKGWKKDYTFKITKIYATTKYEKMVNKEKRYVYFTAFESHGVYENFLEFVDGNVIKYHAREVLRRCKNENKSNTTEAQ